MTRTGPLGQRDSARTDRAFKDPVAVVNGVVTLRIGRYLGLDPDGALTLELDAGLAAALAQILAGSGLLATSGRLALREAPKVAQLTQTISAAYVQAEVKAIQDKLNELLVRLTQVDHLQE